MAKYAVVMTSIGMKYGVNAFYNGIKYYGNDVDFHLVGGKEEKELFKYTDILYKDIKEMLEEFPIPSTKKGGWQVRFYRYKWAELIADQYDSIMIVDADMLCLNNLMKFFKIAADTGFIIMPNNSWGMSVEKVKELGVEPLKGASSPPFHSLTILDAKKWKEFLQKIWLSGLEENFGDMVTISRVLFRNNWEDYVYMLPNHQWILSTFYLDMIKKINKKYSICEEEIQTIHRRWWMPGVCEKFINDIKQDDKKIIGINNVKIFYNCFKFFNTQCEHKLDWEYPNPKI